MFYSGIWCEISKTRGFVTDPHVPNSGIVMAYKIRRIGRITEGLLLGIAEKVDIVEPIAKFSENLKGKAGIGEIFNVGLEDWSPQESGELKYDLIWNQWCLGHLTDAQLTTYLEKCQKVLKTDGLIIVKENMSTSGGDVFDEVDSSVTRYVTSRCDELKGRMLNNVGVTRSSEIFLRRQGWKSRRRRSRKGYQKSCIRSEPMPLYPKSKGTGLLDVSNIVLGMMRMAGSRSLGVSCQNRF